MLSAVLFTAELSLRTLSITSSKSSMYKQGKRQDSDEQTDGVAHRRHSTSIRLVEFFGYCQETIPRKKTTRSGDKDEIGNRNLKLKFISISKQRQKRKR